MSTETPLGNGAKDEPRIEVIDSAEDFVEGFDAVAEGFGRQARDAIWMSLNPGWDDVSPGGGRARCAARMVERWRATTRDRDGNANTVFLKATVPVAVPDRKSPAVGGPLQQQQQQGRTVAIAGLAIWVQASFVEGRGEAPTDDLRRTTDLEALYPGDEREQRFLAQCFRSLVGRRVEVVREKAGAEPPAVMVLDLVSTT